LPRPSTDRSTIAHDTKRSRLILARKSYSDPYDGQLYAVELRSLAVRALSPQGMDRANVIRRLSQFRYDPRNDLVLVGGMTLPPDADGVRRTPAYDPRANRWISLRIEGDDPIRRRGTNPSVALVYDVKRGLFWAIGQRSEVHVLRLDAAGADPLPLR
jgi:hypothetical protein